MTKEIKKTASDCDGYKTADRNEQVKCSALGK